MSTIRFALLLVATLSWTGCNNSYDAPLPTWLTAPPSDFEGKMQVLGVAQRLTSSGNLSNAEKGVWESPPTSVTLPVGTAFAYVVLDGWGLGHGSLKIDTGKNTIHWNSDDVHWGAGIVKARVTNLNIVPPPGQGTADVVVDMVLADENGDDGWWGIASWQLVSLGDDCPCTTTSTSTSSSTTTSTTLPPVGCCGPMHMQFVTAAGSLKYGAFVPFPFPGGGTIDLDVGPPGGLSGECRHPVVVREGGFRLPSFDISALGYCASITSRACESGSGSGAGTLWDGKGLPGAALTNVSSVGDTSDGTCNPSGQACTPTGAGNNTLGNIDTSFSAAPGGGMRSELGVPTHFMVWSDSVCSPIVTPGCCASAVFGDNPGDLLIHDADFIMTLTTNNATAAFADQNGDGCTRVGLGISSPASLTGAPPIGPCCVPGQRAMLVAQSLAFTGENPVFDVGAQITLPVTVRDCDRPVGMQTCVITTDPCQQ